MFLNKVDDELRLPVEWLKKANRLMKQGKATRSDIASTLAKKLERCGAYRRLEWTDIVLAVTWRLEVADPEHPSHHKYWQNLLSFWRNRKARAKKKRRREQDPAYDAECKRKERARRKRKKQEDPTWQAKQREYARKSEQRIREHEPERWEELKLRKKDTNQRWYQKNKRAHIDKSKVYMETMKQDPERYAAYQTKMRVWQREYYQRNKEKLNRQRQERKRRAQEVTNA